MSQEQRPPEENKNAKVDIRYYDPRTYWNKAYKFPAWLTKYAIYGGIATVGLAIWFIRPFFKPKTIIKFAAGRLAGTLVSLFASNIFWAAWKARGMVENVRHGRKPI